MFGFRISVFGLRKSRIPKGREGGGGGGSVKDRDLTWSPPFILPELQELALKPHNPNLKPQDPEI